MVAILEIKKCYISKTIWPIMMKFCTATHTALAAVQNFKFKNPRWHISAMLKIGVCDFCRKYGWESQFASHTKFHQK